MVRYSRDSTAWCSMARPGLCELLARRDVPVASALAWVDHGEDLPEGMGVRMGWGVLPVRQGRQGRAGQGRGRGVVEGQEKCRT